MRKGFTLIELLVVIAIIGLLASVVLIGLGPSQRSGRDARRVADLRQVQTALQLYFQKKGEYPNVLGWTSLSTALTGAGIGISQIPNDPRHSSVEGSPEYGYQRYDVSIDGDAYNKYVLLTKLEDINNKLSGSSLTGSPDVPGFEAACGKVDSTDNTIIYCMGVQ